jgi:hypothetical protein
LDELGGEAPIMKVGGHPIQSGGVGEGGIEHIRNIAAALQVSRHVEFH